VALLSVGGELGKPQRSVGETHQRHLSLSLSLRGAFVNRAAAEEVQY
jgi:hypothetical protein